MTDQPSDKSPNKRAEEKSNIFEWIEKASEVAGKAIYNAKTGYDQSQLKEKVGTATTQMREMLVDEDKLEQMIQSAVEKKFSALEKRVEKLEQK